MTLPFGHFGFVPLDAVMEESPPSPANIFRTSDSQDYSVGCESVRPSPESSIGFQSARESPAFLLDMEMSGNRQHTLLVSKVLVLPLHILLDTPVLVNHRPCLLDMEVFGNLQHTLLASKVPVLLPHIQ